MRDELSKIISPRAHTDRAIWGANQPCCPVDVVVVRCNGTTPRRQLLRPVPRAGPDLDHGGVRHKLGQTSICPPRAAKRIEVAVCGRVCARSSSTPSVNPAVPLASRRLCARSSSTQQEAQLYLAECQPRNTLALP